MKTAVATQADDDRLTKQLLGLVHHMSASFTRHTREVLDDLGLNETSASVLWMLDPAEPPATMRQLARRIGCDSSNISLVSAKLEQAGLTERRPNPHDARSKLLVLTEAGQAMRERLLGHLQRSIPLSVLPPDDKRELVRLLTVLSSQT